MSLDREISPASARDCVVGFGQRRFAQKEARRKSLDRAAHDAGGILRFDFAFDVDADALDRARQRESVHQIAERILALIEPAIVRERDTPTHDVLAS